jgi:Tol biopolymer transport system component
LGIVSQNKYRPSLICIALTCSTVLSLASCTGGGTNKKVGVPAQGSSGSPSKVSVQGHLLFTRTTGEDLQTIFMASGHSESRLTDPGSYCCLLRISPDHRRMLVMPGGDIPPPVTGGTINLMGTDFKRLKLMDKTLNLVPQAWSPDDTRIAFEGWSDSDPARTGVYTARASDGGGLTRVTKRPGARHDIPLDYSHNGKWLVYYRSVGVDPDPYVGGSLWAIRVDGSDAHQIAGPSAHPAPWARWSEDDSRVLFANERTAKSGAIWTVGADGTVLKRVFFDRHGGFPIQPIWSPDGSHILFALDPTNDAFAHPNNEFDLINADGTGLQLVIGGSDFKSQPEWWP